MTGLTTGFTEVVDDHDSEVEEDASPDKKTENTGASMGGSRMKGELKFNRDSNPQVPESYIWMALIFI
jgi:hypothetical protein